MRTITIGLFLLAGCPDPVDTGAQVGWWSVEYTAEDCDAEDRIWIDDLPDQAVCNAWDEVLADESVSHTVRNERAIQWVDGAPFLGCTAADSYGIDCITLALQ